MTQLLRHRGLRIIGLLVALVLVIGWMLLPPATRDTAPLAGGPPTARGAYHIHSDRSDGSGSVDDIAAAAARAGLQFIVITDHGDGTRQPDAPQYRHGVLVIDAVELNTASGHLVALGMPAAPYPFAGAAADVLEDVRRLGGVGIAAHPDSPRPALRWSAWEVEPDGLEWLNADSGWRDEPGLALARAVLSYGIRPAPAMAALLDRPADLLARWDSAGATRPMPALAAADAHARLGFRQESDPDVSTIHVRLPGYEATFRTFSNHAVLNQPLTGDAHADAVDVLRALKFGRTFTVIDALATPGALDFTATAAQRTTGVGDSIPIHGRVSLRARLSGPPGTTLQLLRNGVVVGSTTKDELVLETREPGVYRIEAYTAGAPGLPPIPWVLSNPIYVGLHDGLVSPAPGAATPSSRIPARTADASTEKGTNDVSELVDEPTTDSRDRRFAGEPPIGWRYALAPGVAAGQYAAVALPTIGGLADFGRVRFTVRASAPVRAWVQLRAGSATERWGRTFYADGESRLIDLPLTSFRPIGSTSTAAAPLPRIESLLFVIDTLNNRPGSSGSLTLSEIAFVR
ncbi:MAG: PHP domain-containing protein [Acidobacteriota bacterium]|nr:PHP domain-containing protein [Acidobacteriota bacterium]